MSLSPSVKAQKGGAQVSEQACGRIHTPTRLLVSSPSSGRTLYSVKTDEGFIGTVKIACVVGARPNFMKIAPVTV